MTTARSSQKFRLPDPPENPDDKMTNFDHMSATGSAHHLKQHFGNMETTLIAGEHYLARIHTRNLSGVRYPDLLIAFDVDPAAYKQSNSYVISEQGKPPDFVLEIASRSSGQEDVVGKRRDYAALGIPEYWRFDETGNFHGARLAGDHLTEDGQYQPILIEEVADGIVQGYSRILNLLLRWESGQLKWHDSATGRHIATFEDEREARVLAEARLREQSETLAREREARLLAEARARELEEKLESLGNQ